MIRTLVVEDEAGIRFFLKEALQQMGHSVQVATGGQEALDLLHCRPFDLVMLDLKLGGRIDGLDVLQMAKWIKSEIVVIILTAYGSFESALKAIDLHVDGYLLKPVGVDELRQAINHNLARHQKASLLGQVDRAVETKSETQAHILERAGFRVDLKKHQVKLNGNPLELTFSEFKLLAHLMENAHRVVPAPELVQVVQKYEIDNKREAREMIKWNIHRLRKKVEPEPSKPRIIVNVRGVGYTFGCN